MLDFAEQVKAIMAEVQVEVEDCITVAEICTAESGLEFEVQAMDACIIGAIGDTARSCTLAQSKPLADILVFWSDTVKEALNSRFAVDEVMTTLEERYGEDAFSEILLDNYLPLAVYNEFRNAGYTKVERPAWTYADYRERQDNYLSDYMQLITVEQNTRELLYA